MKHEYLILGGSGLVGSAIKHEFVKQFGVQSVAAPSSRHLNLMDQVAVSGFFQEFTPRVVVNAAARVGGIGANSSLPYQFIQDNLEMQTNVFRAAEKTSVQKLVFLGSSCIYPANSAQPISPSQLLSGALEETNKPYAIAKISGVITVEAIRRELGLPWISLMPTNMYGPNDNYAEGASHVLPALIRRYVEAADKGESRVQNWGSGKPRREFLHVADLARAVLTAVEKYDDPEPLNIGSGEEVSIRKLADLVSQASGFSGTTEWDASKPDGVASKLLDSSRIMELGWRPEIGLEQGIRSTVEAFRADSKNGKARL